MYIAKKNLSKTNIFGVFMKNFSPYLRFISRTSSLPNKRHTVAYDCRFLYVLSGRGKILLEGGELSLTPDTLLYYPSGIRYHVKSSPSEPMQFITVNFDFTDGYEKSGVLRPVYTENYDEALLQPSQKEIDEPLFLSPFLVEEAGNLLDYLVKAIEISREGGEYSEQLTSSLLRSLILEILHGKNRSLPNNKIILEATAYIRANFKEPLTNGSIANTLKYHPYYLGSLFREHLGKTPREYIEEVRQAHAAELLALTDFSIYEIAMCCGYKTAEHFTRRFKLHYGTTPTEWRKRRLV